MAYRLVKIEAEFYQSFDKTGAEFGIRGGKLISELVKGQIEDYNKLEFNHLRRASLTPEIPVNIPNDLLILLKEKAAAVGLDAGQLLRLFLIREHVNQYKIARSLAEILAKKEDRPSYLDRLPIPVNQDFFYRMTEYCRLCSIKNFGPVIMHCLDNMLGHPNYDSYTMTIEPRGVYKQINASRGLAHRLSQKARQHQCINREAANKAFAMASEDNWALFKESLREYIEHAGRHIFTWHNNRPNVGTIDSHDDAFDEFFEELDSLLPFINNVTDADLY